MSDWVLTGTHIRKGVWHGIVMGGEGTPDLEALHLDKAVPDVEIEDTAAGWTMRVPIPEDAIADGVQTFLIVDKADGARLGHFTLMAGEALGDDIRVEMELLRAELDMLKRAFRRHCLETA